MHQNEVIIKGGLGNQLFCLFYAYKILLQSNHKVYLNLSNYFFSNREDRIFILESLYPKLFEDFNKSDSFISRLIFLYVKIHEKLFIRQQADRLPGEKNFVVSFWPKKYIHSGYHQKITSSDLDNKTLNLMKKKIEPIFIKNKINFLAIHIRRGDYLSKNHNIHGIILEEHLQREANKILKKGNFDGITIFSDSPELINKKIFKNLHKNIIIDGGGNPFEVFKRMINHKGLIASNSSFSLWAGLLGDMEYFSIPYFWMKNVKSELLGLEDIYRFNCNI